MDLLLACDVPLFSEEILIAAAPSNEHQQDIGNGKQGLALDSSGWKHLSTISNFSRISRTFDSLV